MQVFFLYLSPSFSLRHREACWMVCVCVVPTIASGLLVLLASAVMAKCAHYNRDYYCAYEFEALC